MSTACTCPLPAPADSIRKSNDAKHRVTETSPCCFEREQVTDVAAQAPAPPGNWKPVVAVGSIAVVVTLLRFASYPGAAPGTVVL